MKYTSLHNHSNFSMYDGLGYPKDFYDYVLKNGGDSLAITEHGSMNSLGYAVTAAKELKAKGVPFRPIYGVEAYVLPSIQDWFKIYNQDDSENAVVIEDEGESKSKHYDPIKRRHHLVITALNNTGLQNLFTLVSLSYRRENFYRFPRMDFDMLRRYNDGLAISTACLAGLPTWCSLSEPNASQDAVMGMYDRELLPLLEIFGKDRAFLELQFNALQEQTIVNRDLIEYSNRSGYKLIVASDAHYCRPDLWREREIYKSLGRQMMKGGVEVDNIPKSIEELKCELYPHNAEQIYSAYEKYFRTSEATDDLVKDAINRTHDIAWHLVGDVQPDSTIKLPKFVPVSSEVKTPFGQLKKYCIDRLKQKGLDGNKTYVDRTIYELKIIRDLNISEYFLTKKGILDALRKSLLLGVGRGSAAGSLVCYLLDLTLADPIKGELLFERFISPSRAEMPDIDSDCEDKDIAFGLLQNEFGADDVVAISNYNTLKLKSMVKDVARLYSIPYDEVNACTKVMETEAKDSIMTSIGHDQKLYEFTYAAAYQHSPTFKSFIDKNPQVGECLANLYKSVKSIGRHAGGVLIVPDAHKHMPIIRVRNVLQSPFTEGITAQHLKLFGLIKFDVLGLTTLRIMRRCIEFILKKDQRTASPTTQDVWDFYNANLHPDVIAPDDSHVFKKVYHEGRFPSVFQFAETRVQEFCKRARPTHVKDISAITALWRPGPLAGKADERYLAAVGRKVKYDHPILEEVLGDTRGVLLYQEQFMLLANKLAGFTLDEADKLRKLLVKPSHELGEEMRQQRIKVGEKFVTGCVEKGLTRDRAQKLWHDEIMGFISYGFNKSHSYVYAYNSYQCAWLYTYYETEWIKACLEKDPDLERTINGVAQLGYRVGKPDVNFSLADEWQIDANKNCIPPMTALKGVGSTAADELIRIRPPEGFSDIYDFFYGKDEKGNQKWRWSKFNKKSLDALIRLEALDSLRCVGGDAMFVNYRHMHSVIFENFDKIKKGVTKEGRGKNTITHDLMIETLDVSAAYIEDWTTAEKIAQQKELTGLFDKTLLFTSDALAMIQKYNITPFTEVKEEDAERHWFFIDEAKVQETQTGKPYLKMKISDGQGFSRNVNYFQSIPKFASATPLCVAKMVKQDFWINIEGNIHILQ